MPTTIRLRWAHRANNEAPCLPFKQINCTEPSVAEPLIMGIHSFSPTLSMVLLSLL